MLNFAEVVQHKNHFHSATFHHIEFMNHQSLIQLLIISGQSNHLMRMISFLSYPFVYIISIAILCTNSWHRVMIWGSSGS